MKDRDAFDAFRPFFMYLYKNLYYPQAPQKRTSSTKGTKNNEGPQKKEEHKRIFTTEITEKNINGLNHGERGEHGDGESPLTLQKKKKLNPLTTLMNADLFRPVAQTHHSAPEGKTGT